MKRVFALMLVLLSLLSLAACAKQAPPPVAQTDYSLQLGDKSLTLGETKEGFYGLFPEAQELAEDKYMTLEPNTFEEFRDGKLVRIQVITPGCGFGGEKGIKVGDSYERIMEVTGLTLDQLNMTGKELNLKECSLSYYGDPEGKALTPEERVELFRKRREENFDASGYCYVFFGIEDGKVAAIHITDVNAIRIAS